MKKAWVYSLLGLLAIAGVACSSSKPYVDEEHRAWETRTLPPEAERVYQVYLIGDGGAPARGATEPVLNLLKTHLDAANAQSAVVFLGDNIYCCGLPDSAEAKRADAEFRIVEQLKTVKDFAGRVVMIPGNHDWNHSQKGGLEALARQEAFVEDYLQRGNVFLPDDGFPGPVDLKLTDDLRLLVLDTEWWLTTEHEKPYGDAGDYTIEEDGDFLLQVNELVEKHENRQLLVVGHHPVHSNGIHAGYFPVRTHLFPLTDLWKYAYVPLPIIGSIYPLFIRLHGGKQDLAHPRYQTLRYGLERIFSNHEALVYAAGHEHNLQYFSHKGNEGKQHYIVSGSGSKQSPVRGGGDVHFASTLKGFTHLQYYRDGQVWMDVWAPEGEGQEGRLLFRVQLQETAPEKIDRGLPADTTALPDFRDSTIVTAVNPAYDAAGGLKRFMWGEHHRRTWATPVAAPVLDLGREAGGLTPIKRGGGMQTISLRLRNDAGDEYVLRSLDKSPYNSIPPELRETYVRDIIADQTSAQQPFGAFIIPPLAEAAGVYHTLPRLVYVPSDPRLGIYEDAFADQVMMLEERPDGDRSDAPHFGRSKEIVSAAKMYRAITSDNDDRVDQRAFVRARLFDMLLSDWDRHRDQWRWASFKEPKGKGRYYRPIPRDRDWAFNKWDGLLPSLFTFYDPKFQDFTDDYGYLPGLTGNGLEQDRRLLAALPQRAWVEVADSIRASLSDAIIEDAVRRWPEPIYALSGEEAIQTLKTRRDKLTAVAIEYYHLLAKVTDVVGSRKHEAFVVNRRNDRETEVVMYKASKKGKRGKERYRRVFYTEETKEIRLYGLDGNDHFEVTGTVQDGIRIIAVGGTGQDTFTDSSAVGGVPKMTHFYDSDTGNTWKTGNETRVVQSDNPAVNDYDQRGSFQYDRALPEVFLGYNIDDGVFLGGGANITKHGFRKAPFARNHRVVANVAAKTWAFNFLYEGRFTDVLGTWDLGLNALARTPNNILNYYGLGNETRNDADDRSFYQARLSHYAVEPLLWQTTQNGAAFYVGPAFNVTRVQEDSTRFIPEPQPGLSPTTFENQFFAVVKTGFNLESIDNQLNPRQGVRWMNTLDFNFGVTGGTASYTKLASALSLYYSPLHARQVTLALRAGGAHNWGLFPFFGANTLGGTTNLRGYRGNRYTGRTSFYTNLEVRAMLLNISTRLAVGSLGVLGFFDNGRVWTDGESSRVWHQGYGGGLWLSFFDYFILKGSVGFSKDDTTFLIDLGFFF